MLNAGTHGWYLYGITRRAPLADLLAQPDMTPVQLLECSGLAAVVREVPLEDFSLTALQERLRSASELESMAREHNRVIGAIHARQTILPARFAMVYQDSSDILSALRTACDTLLPQLSRLEGCDEWAVHLYARRSVLQDSIAARIPAIGRLRQEYTEASPGRAYFLGRQLRDELESATREALAELAQHAFERLSEAAVTGLVSRAASAADGVDDVEILRAAFLVARDGIVHFDSELSAVVDPSEGLRAECSGPWPPYSFALEEVEVAR